MNTYEEKQEARKERYEALALANKAKASAQYKRGHDALDAIPFGQPIACNSRASADRAYRERAVASIGRSFETEKKAEYYEQKAESVGTGGISSDDPDAVAKLKEKLSIEQNRHDAVKMLNAEDRKNGLKPRYMPYVLSNGNARINAIKKRIEQLEAKASMQVRETVKGDGFELVESLEENRIMFVFKGKPDESVRSTLKRYGFKWSPTRGAWVRQLNNAGRYAAEMVIRNLASVPCEKCGGARDVWALICSKCTV